MATVHETCSCGATFSFSGTAPDAMTRIWRSTHRHDTPTIPAGTTDHEQQETT